MGRGCTFSDTPCPQGLPWDAESKRVSDRKTDLSLELGELPLDYILWK